MLNKAEGDTPPGAPMMESVEAVAGRLRAPVNQAANEMAAVMFILVLVWLWDYANSRAKSVNSEAVLRKITRSQISEASAAKPAWALGFWLISA